MSDTDELIADALHDLAAQAAPVPPAADALWRAGQRRRRLSVLATSAAAGAIVGALVVALTWPTWALATVAVPRHQHRRLPCGCGHPSCSRRWRRQAGRPARFTLRRCWPLTRPRVSSWVASG